MKFDVHQGRNSNASRLEYKSFISFALYNWTLPNSLRISDSVRRLVDEIAFDVHVNAVVVDHSTRKLGRHVLHIDWHADCLTQYRSFLPNDAVPVSA